MTTLPDTVERLLRRVGIARTRENDEKDRQNLRVGRRRLIHARLQHIALQDLASGWELDRGGEEQDGTF